MMMKIVYALLCFLVMIGLVSCDLPARHPPNSSQSDIDQQYRTVSVLLTRTAQVTPVSKTALVVPSTPVPAIRTAAAPAATVTLAVVDEQPVEPSATPTRGFTQPAGKAISAPCDLAQLGYPIDINIPDGSHFQPGEPFSKTWRLVNAGSCQWTSDYAVVWFSGNDMALNQAQPLNVEVRPGDSIDVTVDMVAPLVAGAYQSNWKMRNQEGALFGIGPNGNAPFWVRIAVVPLDTPTATLPIVEATPTPIIFASGSLTLLLGDGIDLDSAQINQSENDDLLFQSPIADEVQLAPLTGADLVSFGKHRPQFPECNLAGSNEIPVALGQDLVGTYLCYRTSKGLPGWIKIKSVDLEKRQIELEFITWAVP